MSAPEPRIAQAWLTALDSGVVELTRDWTADTLPPLTLGPDGPAFATLERVRDHSFGRDSGYFVNTSGEIFFFIELARHPDLGDGTTAVYLAGDFNGWQRAVGDAAWKLRPASLDGAPVLLFAGSAERFYARPPQRFKFVTEAHRWLPVSSLAPNALRDDLGNYNYTVDPARTGRHLFRFTTAAPIDLCASTGVSWADRSVAERAPLRPGDFFYRLRSHAPLGAIVERGRGDETVFRLFAPRARCVTLHLCNHLARVDQAVSYSLDRRGDGAWEARLQGNLHGWYYWYTLDGPANVFGRFERDRRILDPYALAVVGRDGPGIVIDRARIAPPDRTFQAPQWQDLVIAEAHVRDLSALAPVPATAAERRGFTGLRKWVESAGFHLARLGVNAVELQPVQEFDSATREEYAWGYMPVAWFAPASSYALAPEKGSQIKELQDLVLAFHRRGQAVIFDVVYNHVGVPEHLMAIDKLYYFEQDGAGNLANWSGCGNDVRTHAAMTRRLIIDSLIHLIEVYGADGFRFDLAELIGVEVLREIETALKRVKPDIVLIAEPWSFRGHIAKDLRTTGYASWNDGFRNFLGAYVRGGGTREAFEYFVRGSPWFFARWPAQTVNYTESHDDRTWIDAITENAGGNGANPTDRDRRRTHLMCAMLLGSIGMPMLAAGQDLLRSKQGVGNTYQRGDLNAIDYGRQERFPDTHAYFADWIAFRRSDRGRLLRLFTAPAEGFFRFAFAPDSTAGAVVFNADLQLGPQRLMLAVNPTLEEVGIPLGEAAGAPWLRLADHARFFSAAESAASQPLGAALRLPGLSCGLWIAG